MSQYAAPADFFQAFGLGEAAQLLADEQQLLTEQLLKDALAVSMGGAWSGSPTQAERDAANAARLVRELLAKSNFMDGYLRSVVTLPLPDGDANASTLRECCLGLVRCALADDTDNATERMDKLREQWLAWLKDVSARRVSLVSSSTGQTMAPLGSVRFGQAKSAYSQFGWGMLP
jgi:phage gp36-like protein